jgi:hypothetical protein
MILPRLRKRRTGPEVSIETERDFIAVLGTLVARMQALNEGMDALADLASAIGAVDQRLADIETRLQRLEAARANFILRPEPALATVLDG